MLITEFFHKEKHDQIPFPVGLSFYIKLIVPSVQDCIAAPLHYILSGPVHVYSDYLL